MIHVDSCRGFIRFYKKGDSYEEKSPYKALMSYHALSPETIYIDGTMGRLASSDIDNLYKILKDKHFKRVIGYFPTKFLPRMFEPLPKTDLHIVEL